MKSLFHLFSSDDTYGPGTDLAMALLGIFILSAAITKRSDAVKSNRLKEIAEKQVLVIGALAQNYNTSPRFIVRGADSLYLIATSGDRDKSIAVRNSETTQLFTFGESLLFDVAKAELSVEGRKVIGDLGKIIKGQARLLAEIQIQGHADISPPSRFDQYKSNIELASARATTVFNLFKENSGIDPSNILMSIASYGEFKPVQRNVNQANWNQDSLNVANGSPEKREQNRRIEIVLIFR
jgi:flagellar motor protein MotB